MFEREPLLPVDNNYTTYNVYKLMLKSLFYLDNSRLKFFKRQYILWILFIIITQVMIFSFFVLTIELGIEREPFAFFSLFIFIFLAMMFMMFIIVAVNEYYLDFINYLKDQGFFIKQSLLLFVYVPLIFVSFVYYYIITFLVSIVILLYIFLVVSILILILVIYTILNIVSCCQLHQRIEYKLSNINFTFNPLQ